LTSTSVAAVNIVEVGRLSETMTQAAILAITATNTTFTPIPYDADMSPTALPNFSPMPTLTPTLTVTPLA
jgi:hypothetical protein